MRCPGSVALTQDMPDETSKFAEEGTLAHWLGALVLTAGEDSPAKFYMEYYPDGDHTCEEVPNTLRVTHEMQDFIRTYTDYVNAEVERTGGTLLVEQQVDFSATLGVQPGEATGTADAIIVSDDEIVVIDLKYGRGVQVFAESEQLKLYALGAMEQHDPLGLVEKYKLVIVQPRLDHIDELVMTNVELSAFGDEAKIRAKLVLDAVETYEQGGQISDFMAPSEKACQWCKAKATCPALSRDVAQTVQPNADDMEDIAATLTPDGANWLGIAMSKVGMIEDWCKAVRAAVEGELIAGRAVPGYKLVEGRRGARSWSDETAAEELLRKTFRLKVEEAYDLKLISPTKAEKVLADSPRRWNKAKALITQGQGKPSVAPESDKRPAISVAPDASGMEDLSTEVEM